MRVWVLLFRSCCLPVILKHSVRANFVFWPQAWLNVLLIILKQKNQTMYQAPRGRTEKMKPTGERRLWTNWLPLPSGFWTSVIFLRGKCSILGELCKEVPFSRLLNAEQFPLGKENVELGNTEENLFINLTHFLHSFYSAFLIFFIIRNAGYKLLD